MVPARAEPNRNLVLVHTEGWQKVSDFEDIKRRIEASAPDIEVFIASNDSRSSIVRKKAARRPTLIFSPVLLMAFSPERGKIYAGQPMSKLTEMSRLTRAGMPVPPFEQIMPGTVLAPEVYGEFTVVKPSYELASWGQGVELQRTEHVRYCAPEDYPQGHPGRLAPMIAQKFIDCGKPMTCRVLTLFGAPLFTFVRESTRALMLEPSKLSYTQTEYMPAAPHIRVYTTHDQDFLACAQAAYRAMPDVALQACDILRDTHGQLHLLEVNPGGGTWMLSSPSASGYRRVLGTDDLAAEFDAFGTCARVLIERARSEAC